MICVFRLPNLFYTKISKIESKKKEHILFLVLCYIPSRISEYFDNYIKQIAADEWDTMKTKKNGSEMYLFFQRKGQTGEHPAAELRGTFINNHNMKTG
jgi:hypothetical protein